MIPGSPADRSQVLRDGQRSNANSFGPKFRVRRFYLDTAKNRKVRTSSDHFFASGVKSFWVCDTNNEDFVATIVPNPGQDSDQSSGLPLRPNSCQAFTFPVDDACLEFEAQSGVWIDIAYSENEDITVLSLTANVAAETDGSSALVLAAITLTAAAAELIASDTTRKVLNLYATAAWEISDASQAQWFPVPANTPVQIKNTAQFYARSSYGAVVSRMKES